MRKRLALVVSVAALLVSLGAPPATSAVVIIGLACTTCGFAYKWNRRITSVTRGAKVTWKGVAGKHTVTAVSSNWSKNTTISQGGSTSFTFKSAGTYRFRCVFHPIVTNGMCGKVVVG